MKITYLDARSDEVVEEPHLIITIENTDFYNDWFRFTVDLTEMCKTVGKRAKDYDPDTKRDYCYVDYPIPRFKKALKLIHKFSDDDQKEQVQWYLNDHFPKWAAEFRKLG